MKIIGPAGLFVLCIVSALCAQAATPAPATAADSRPLVAVKNLDAQGVSATDAALVGDQLRSQLMSARRFRVIERSQMEAILKEQGFQQSGCTSDECAVEVGQMLGVKYMMVGSLGMIGSYTVLSARYLDVGTGEILFNETVRTQGGLDRMVDKGVDEMVKKITTDFDQFTGKAPAVAEKKANLLPVIAGVGGALLVGGGAAAYFVLMPKKKTESPAATTGDITVQLP